MTRDILRRYTKEMNKQKDIQQQEIIQKNLPPPQPEKININSIDDVIYILFDENIKSKTVREVKAKSSLIEYLMGKYENM
jgi:hypothetical protein